METADIKKKIGILGGMGPEATARLFSLTIEYTQAGNDADHIPVFINNDTQIPDRTEAILGRGPSPLPALIEAASKLQNAGADLILMPCHTAHHYHSEIVSHLRIPFLNMIEEVAAEIHGFTPAIKNIGLLATTGTVRTGLFQNALSAHGLVAVIPAQPLQTMVMEAIYGPEGLKAGYKTQPKEILSKVADQLISENIHAMVTGCTEISLVLDQGDLSVPVFNSLGILARAGIRAAGYPLREPPAPDSSPTSTT